MSIVRSQARHLQGATPPEGDAELLARFVADRNEAAFAALVHRHGPMVWAVCRNALPCEADAEDAFQATFLDFLRRARSIRHRAALGAWLHSAAVRVCLKARRSAARRMAREARVALSPSAATEASAWADDLTRVHREIQLLPRREHEAFVACVLQGVPQAEVARRLGLQTNSVSCLLARARRRLRVRLAARGALPVLALCVAASSGPAAVPAPLLSLTCRLAAPSVILSRSVSSLSTSIRECVMRKIVLMAFIGLSLGAAVTAGKLLIGSAEAQASDTTIRRLAEGSRAQSVTTPASDDLLTVSLSGTQGESEPAVYPRLISRDTLGFLHVNMAAVMRTEMWRETVRAIEREGRVADFDQDSAKTFGVPLSQWESVTFYLDAPPFVGGVPREPAPPYVLVRTTQPVGAQPWVTALGSGVEKTTLGKVTLYTSPERGVAVLDDRHVLLLIHDRRRGRDEVAQYYRRLFSRYEKPAELPAEFAKHFARLDGGKHIVAGVAVLPEELRQFIANLAGEAPPQIQPFLPLLAAKSMSYRVDMSTRAGSDLRAEYAVEFPDAAKAQAGVKAVNNALAMGKAALGGLEKQDPLFARMSEMFSKWATDIKVTANGNQMEVALDVQTRALTSLVPPAVVKMRNAADRMLSASNMRQMLIAMHNYHNDFEKLPPVASFPGGNAAGAKPLHSWRVHILPYIEQAELHRQFKLDEPWDSPHNKAVFEKNPMPKIYEHPAKKDGHTKMTYYKALVSKPGVKLASAFTLGQDISLGQITVQDGTSNTAALIETGPPVMWTKPEDVDVDVSVGLPKLTSTWKEPRVNVAFFDGSIRLLHLGLDDNAWKAILTRNGGEQVDLSKLEGENK